MSLWRRLRVFLFVCLFFLIANLILLKIIPADEYLLLLKSGIRDSLLYFSFLKSMGKTIALG